MSLFTGKRYIEMKDDYNTDCNKYSYEYIPHILEPTNRTIAIGDIHGDLVVAIGMLKVAKCIKKIEDKTDNCITVKNKFNKDEYYIWIGNKTQVVQVGDQVDRCRPVDNDCRYPQTTIDDEASDIKILNFYTDVDKAAKLSGGRVISLLGNHELMNVQGAMKYVSFMGLVEFNNNVDLSTLKVSNDMDEMIEIGLKNRKDAFSNKNNSNRKLALNEFLACSRTSSIIIGSLLFVHGGMIKKMAEAYNLDDLNKIVRKWLLGKLTTESESKPLLYTNKEKTNKEKPIKNLSFNYKDRIYQLISAPNSIFWNRILGHLPADLEGNDELINQKCDGYLKEVFEILDIGGIVIGHTPQMSEKYGINSACNKKVWRVDIGASSAFNSFKNKNNKRIEVLQITYDVNKTPIFEILR